MLKALQYLDSRPIDVVMELKLRGTPSELFGCEEALLGHASPHAQGGSVEFWERTREKEDVGQRKE